MIDGSTSQQQAARLTNKVESEGKALSLVQVHCLYQAKQGERFLEIQLHFYDDWLDPDPNASVTVVVRLAEGILVYLLTVGVKDEGQLSKFLVNFSFKRLFGLTGNENQRPAS